MHNSKNYEFTKKLAIVYLSKSERRENENNIYSYIRDPFANRIIHKIGLNELIKVSGLNLGDIESYHLGYILGPRINAAGRIGSPIDAVKLLVSDNSKICARIAEYSK